MTTPSTNPMEDKKKVKYSMGVTILLLLSAATIGEYGIAAVSQSLLKINVDLGVVLMMVALFKAFLVVRDYMHVGRLFSNEEEH